MTPGRRLYLYLASFIGLQFTLWTGSSILAEVLKAGSLANPGEFALRSTLTIFALILYTTHWRRAQGMAKQSEEERSTLLRWLYLYGTLTLLLLSMLVAGFKVVVDFFDTFTLLKRPWFSLYIGGLTHDNGFYFPPISTLDWVVFPVMTLLCLYYWGVMRDDLHILVEDERLFTIHTYFSTGIGLLGLFLVGIGILGTLGWVLPPFIGQEITPSPNSPALLLISLPLASFLTIGLRARREPEIVEALRGILTFIFSAIGLFLLTFGSATLTMWLLITIGGGVRTIHPNYIFSSGGIWLFLAGLAIWYGAWCLKLRRLLDADPKGYWITGRMSFSFLAIVIFSWSAMISGARLLNMLLLGLLTPGSAIPLASDDPWHLLATLIVSSAMWAYHVSVRRTGMKLSSTKFRSVLRRRYLVVSSMIGIVACLVGLSGILGGVMRAFPPITAIDTVLRKDIATSITLGVVGAVIWLNHSTLMRSEARLWDERHEEQAIIWNQLHIISFVGLVGLLISLAGEIGLLVQVFSAEPFGYGLRHELGLFTGALLIGLPAWALSRRKVQSIDEMTQLPGDGDFRPITRRIYFIACMLLAALMVLWGLVHCFAALLHVPRHVGIDGLLLFDLGRALGFLLVGSGTLIYYVMNIRTLKTFKYH